MNRKSTASARRTQAERRDESERGLLQAAIAIMAEDGVGAATFDAIGRQGGFSRGLASQHFGSKQGLVEAVIAHLAARHEALLASWGVDAKTGLEAVLSYVDLGLSDMARKGEGRAYFMLLSSAVADASALRQAFAANHAGVERRLEAWIKSGQAAGDIRPEIDADAAALMIGCLMFGMSMQLLVDPEMNIEPIKAMGLASLRLMLEAPGKAGGAALQDQPPPKAL